MQSIWHRRVWASFGLLLFCVTWRLWTPQLVFPQVPFISALTDVPGYVDWLAAVAGVLSLLLAGWATREAVWRRAMMAFAGTTVLLILLNQHRFQPWAYQYVLFATIVANCSERIAMRLMRWIVVSIYVYSAVSKFDYQFLHSLGPQFLSTLAGFVGLTSADWPVNLQAWLASLFPFGELLVGIGLLVPRTRRAAIFAAIGLHLLLLQILGPWGLAHQPGVIVWNLYFMVQVWMLFADRRPDQVTTAVDTNRGVTETMCFVLTSIVIALPASESLGYCDHWPAWEVYSPRSSRAQLAIHDSAVDRLPPELKKQLSPASEFSDWRQLHIDRWSLASLSVPIYPEDRFQIGVALALADRFELGLAIHVTQQSASNRRTGERREHSLTGRDPLHAARRLYRFNVDARSTGRLGKER